MIRPRFSQFSIFRSIFLVAMSLATLSMLRAQTVFTWTAGDVLSGGISPSGFSTLGSSDVLNIVSTNDHDFNGRTLINNGSVNWNAGALRTGNGGTFTNQGLWLDSGANNNFNGAYGGPGGATFINASNGSYIKSVGTTDFTAPLNNAGTINVLSGFLNIDAGGTFTDGSVLSSSGLGVLQLLSGTLTMTGNIKATNFLFNGGVFAGDQTFNTSVINWQTGDWNSPNTTTLASDSTLNLVSGNDHNFNGHAIVNNGTINWTQGNLRSGNGGTITNNATWNDTADGFEIDDAYGGTGGTNFINAPSGTYRKLTGISTFSIPLSNYGAVVVSGGTLNLAAGGIFYDGSSIGSSGTGVVQLTSGILSAGGNAGFTASNFLLTGGSLSGNMTFLGSTNWVASDFNTTGTATIAPSASLFITSGNDHDFSSHAIVNNGTVNWVAGSIRSGNGGTITNNGMWNDSATGYAVNDAYGGTGGTTFTNGVQGVYVKTSGTTTFADTTLVNNGLISVTGGEIDISGATFNNGSTIGSSGQGLVQFVAGTLTANGTINVQNFVLSGGNLTGTQTFDGTLNWIGADFNSTGATTIDTSSIFSISSGNDHNYSSHAIVNNGIVNWSAGSLRSGNGGTFTNNGTFNDSVAGYAINNAYGGTGGTTFLNSARATYLKTSGLTTFSDSTLVNNGLISATGGEIDISGAILNNGSTLGSSGSGVVQLVGGTITANGTINVLNLLFANGQITGTQTFQGSLDWINGDFNTSGVMTLGNAGTMDITSANDHNFNGHALINQGTINWTSGSVRSGNGGTLTNAAIWNDNADGYAINNAYGGPGGTTYINAATGVYNKNGGASTISADLDNQGTINVAGGSLAVSGNFTNSGALVLAAGASLNSPNALTFGSTSNLSGNGNLIAPSLADAGTIFAGSATAAGMLNLTSNLTLIATSRMEFLLGGLNQGSQYDFISVSGTVNAGGKLEFSFANGFQNSVTGSTTLTLLSATALLNSFSNVANGDRIATLDGLGTFVVNYGASSPFAINTVVLSNFQAVPEPSTWALLATGACGLLIVRRRRAS